MRLFNLRLESGFLKLPDNPPLPDDGPSFSSGLSRASSGQQLEPDDYKPLTYAGYSDYRRVRRVKERRGRGGGYAPRRHEPVASRFRVGLDAPTETRSHLVQRNLRSDSSIS